MYLSSCLGKKFDFYLARFTIARCEGECSILSSPSCFFFLSRGNILSNCRLSRLWYAEVPNLNYQWRTYFPNNQQQKGILWIDGASFLRPCNSWGIWMGRWCLFFLGFLLLRFFLSAKAIFYFWDSLCSQNNFPMVPQTHLKGAIAKVLMACSNCIICSFWVPMKTICFIFLDGSLTVEERLHVVETRF